MQKLLLVFITLVFAIKGKAQTIEISVSGSKVYTKNLPVEPITISLMKSKESATIRIDVTDKSEIFFLNWNFIWQLLF